MLEVDETTVWRWESGKTQPSTKLRVFHELGVRLGANR